MSIDHVPANNYVTPHLEHAVIILKHHSLPLIKINIYPVEWISGSFVFENTRIELLMNVNLKCQCGAVTGVASDITPESGNRVVCCCDDCQRFAGYLNRESDVLDEFGGTDIYQTSQAQVNVTRGAEQLRCVRLSKKGLIRWYTDCCKTPIGNTMSAGVPFIGVVHSFMDLENDRDNTLGPVRAYVQVKHATGEHTYPHSADKFPLGITLRIASKMLVWKITGKSKPSAFFDDNGKPVSSPTVVS